MYHGAVVRHALKGGATPRNAQWWRWCLRSTPHLPGETWHHVSQRLFLHVMLESLVLTTTHMSVS